MKIILSTIICPEHTAKQVTELREEDNTILVNGHSTKLTSNGLLLYP